MYLRTIIASQPYFGLFLSLMKSQGIKRVFLVERGWSADEERRTMGTGM